jgi:hypothetical protein
LRSWTQPKRNTRRTIAQFDANQSRRRVDEAVNRDLDQILGACGDGHE